MVVDEFTQSQVLGEGDRKEQPSIGHQAVVVEGDVDAVGLLRWWHLLGAPRFGSVWSLQNHYPRSREHFLTISARRYSYLFGGLGISINGRDEYVVLLIHHVPPSGSL